MLNIETKIVNKTKMLADHACFAVVASGSTAIMAASFPVSVVFFLSVLQVEALPKLLTKFFTYPSLERHCTESWKQMFPERKLRGLSPNFCIHISVSDLYTGYSTIGLPIWMQENRWTAIMGIYKSLTDI
jgi:hypothetical protein